MNVGQVKIILHRPLEGTPKTATIPRSSTGKWYVCFSCECAEPAPLPPTGQDVGIDVGLKTFAMPTQGEPIANPRFFRREEQALAGAQRRLSREEKGTPARAERRRVVARVHERIAWRRGDFAHQHSRRLVNQFDLIAVEDLSVNRMVHNHCLAKSIHDAAWSQFADLPLLQGSMGRSEICRREPRVYVVRIAPAVDIGKRSPSLTALHCPCCGLVLDRDLNAARNILRLARDIVGIGATIPGSGLEAPAFIRGSCHRCCLRGRPGRFARHCIVSAQR